MKTDAKGNYLTFENDPENIDYYIEQFCDMYHLLNRILAKAPETREAILNSSYKDLLCARVQFEQMLDIAFEIARCQVLYADDYEAASCAGEHPLTYGYD